MICRAPLVILPRTQLSFDDAQTISPTSVHSTGVSRAGQDEAGPRHAPFSGNMNTARQTGHHRPRHVLRRRKSTGSADVPSVDRDYPSVRSVGRRSSKGEVRTARARNGAMRSSLLHDRV